jgi:2-polyprenyl-3-methyl-5-hydroxy-6-metoxy-1,4-benzoquinol methylase
VPTGSVLDLGAGEGANARYFAEHGYTVTAVERDAAALAALRQLSSSYADVRVIGADIRDLPELGRFDVVLCRMVLHFLSSRDQVHAVIRRMQGITNQHGVNAVSLLSSRNPVGTRPYLAAPDELARLYADWMILNAFEGRGGALPDGQRNYVSRLTARRVR